MIGTLLYLTASRPDLQFAICMCAQYQARPTEKHIHAVKRIFRYLQGTVNQGLCISSISVDTIPIFSLLLLLSYLRTSTLTSGYPWVDPSDSGWIMGFEYLCITTLYLHIFKYIVGLFAKASKAKSLSALSEVAMTEARQLKLATKRSLQQIHISQASGSGADEGTGDDDEGKDGDGEDEGNDGDDDKEGNDDDADEEGNEDDDDEQDDDDEDDDQEEGGDDEQASNKEEFIHPSLSTHVEEETRDEESFDQISKTPENTNDKGNGEENLGTNAGREEGHDEEEKEDKLYRDVNINLGRGMESIFETTSQMDVQTPTLVAPLFMSAPTLTPSTIATITTTLQAPTPSTTAPSTRLEDLPVFGSLFGFDNRLKTLEANFFKFMQTNQFAGAVSSILGIAQRYMDQRMNEAVKVVVQIQ
nr:putative mitochondrial protein [Tanacetum cinerariifolium]